MEDENEMGTDGPICNYTSEKTESLTEIYKPSGVQKFGDLIKWSWKCFK